MNTFKQFMDDKGYDYGSFDRCEDMDILINEYGKHCATIVQQPLSGSTDATPKLKLNKPKKLKFVSVEDEDGFV